MTMGGSMKLECIQDCMTGMLGVVIAVCAGCLVSMSTSSSAEAAHEMQQESLTPLHLQPQISYSFASNYQIMWADDLIKVYDAGDTVEMALDQTSGSGFVSKNSYYYGNVEMKLKLVPGNSAGVVTAFYMSGKGDTHSELDFEFLGNKSGEPYQLQTNIYGQGVGGREQRVYLWFDPAAKYHSYSFLWNDHQVVFKVDSVPVRVLRKTEETAFMYPNQPMQVFSSIWDGSSWATRGGLDKIDWSQAPFITSCRKFELDACQDDSNILTTPNFSSECQAQLQSHWWGSTAATTLNSHERRKYKYVQENLLVYNYCTDTLRYPTIPPECLITPW
ncbi:hypothetical protein BDL97_19G065300 [Sphagnum fallax]|jgi:xyloglucan:xyloglucosyl transferase|nr:hypothetical protein BDL97_19G065300 [Sphagnum fallax]